VELFTNILDLAGIPQRSFIEGMIPYATSDEERDKLLELSSTQGIDLYFDYCIREKRNYVEFFEDFKSCRPPLEKIIEHISVIKPRHYSIASYDIDSPNQVITLLKILFTLFKIIVRLF
jgi:sulfite reductase alpha subunit-like flavoprotein